MTIRIAGSEANDRPTAAPQGVVRTVGGGGQLLDDALALTQSLLTDGPDDSALARLEAGVDEYVDLWTPSLHTTSRFELVAALGAIDDTVTDVKVSVGEAVHDRSTAVLVWLATGRFSRPAFLDDDHLIEPSGAVVTVAGVTRLSFTASGRAERISCFYDRLSLVEQLLASSSTGDRA